MILLRALTLLVAAPGFLDATDEFLSLDTLDFRGLGYLATAEPSATVQTEEVPQEVEEPSKFTSPEDGWFDVSGFLSEKYGFLPIVVPITEPAVGYGAAVGLAFISKPLESFESEYDRPNI